VSFWSLNPRVSWGPDDIYYKDDEGRALGIALSIDKDLRHKTKILVLYSPNTEREKMAFWQNLPQEVLNQSDIVLGDFNMVCNILDRNPPTPDPPQVVRIVSAKLQDAGLIDGWRQSKPESRAYTHMQSNQYLSTGRIDRIYCTKKVHRKTGHWNIHPAPTTLSDHSVVCMEYNPKLKVKPGKSPWKMNSSFFQSDDYGPSMKTIIKKWAQIIAVGWTEETLPNASLKDLNPYQEHLEDEEALEEPVKGPIEVRRMVPATGFRPQHTVDSWSAFLTEVTDFAAKYQRSQAKKRNKTSKRLQKRLENAKKRQRETPGGRNVRLLQKAQSNWDSYMIAQSDKAKHNAKARWINDGEGNTKQFFAMAKARSEELSIFGLKDPNHAKPEKIWKKQRRMNSIAEEYYRHLYSNEKTDPACQEILLNLMEPNAAFRNSDLTAPITTTELKRITSSWSIGSSPGPNGIPYEWYSWYLRDEETAKPMETLLLCLSTVMICHQEETGSCQPKGWLEGVVSLLYKKGDRAELKNYRPISLINTDYKIVSALINQRLMEPSLGSIGKHQTGFLPGRHILDTIKEAQLLLERANATQSPVYLILLDQEKAYDRVDQQMLMKILQKVGLPATLLRAIRGCLAGATSQISVNKHRTGPIPLNRGVRQGDPLSCLLFNFVIETLAKLVLNTRGLPGVIDSTGNAHKIGLFADDFRINLTHQTQWKIFRKCYDIYGRATQARRNDTKTIILYAGTDNPPLTIGGIALTPKGVAKIYLGIPLGNDIDSTEMFSTIQQKIQDKVERYNHIYISLRGRVKIAKMVMYSKLWYYLRCLPISPQQIKDLEDTVERYIWVRDPEERIKRSLKAAHSVKPFEEGGLNAMDLNTMRLSLNIFWVARMKEYLWPKPAGDAQSPGWISLALEGIMTTGQESLWSQGKFRAQLRYPWAQRWLRSEHKALPSIQYWWRPWVENQRAMGYRHHMRQPASPEEVKTVYFWFHPATWQGENSVKWGSKVWIDLSEGQYGPTPNTVADLVYLQRHDITKYMRAQTDSARVATLQRAITHLLNLLPKEWKEVWNWDREPRPENLHTGQYFDGSVVWSKTGDTLPVSSTNKQFYKLLLANLMDPESLHHRLWGIGQFSELQEKLLTEEPQKVWLMIDQRRIYYPKVTDLLWRILHGTCNAGKPWAVPRDCPICRTRQIPEHLFWDCPAARAVWALHKVYWLKATQDEYPEWSTFADLILDGATVSSNEDNRRRRRILFSEGLWAIWLLQTEWSREGTCDFTTAAVVERFKSRILLRIKVDRLLALGYGTPSISPGAYQRIWGLSVEDNIEAHLTH
jgi:hypothetical protein